MRFYKKKYSKTLSNTLSKKIMNNKTNFILKSFFLVLINVEFWLSKKPCTGLNDHQRYN